MKTTAELAGEYAAETLEYRGTPFDPEAFKSELRLAFFAGYNAGLRFARNVVTPEKEGA